MDRLKCSFEFIRLKNKQAQLQVVTTKKTIVDVKLILQKEITTDVTNIWGCFISEQGNLLFTDHQNKNVSLTVIASDNTLKDRMSLDQSWGFDITMIDDKTVAITTGGNEEKIGVNIIDIKICSKVKFINIPGRTWGITRDHNSLFVCVEESGIYKINTLDFTTSHVTSCNLPTFSKVSVFSDKIYYTNNMDHSVVCCDQNGSRV